MHIAVHLRDGPNLTNARSECLIPHLEEAGHRVKVLSRGERSKTADLVIQTGFARSEALLDAIEREVPYIVMEAPFWRDFYDVHGASSWGYNGLAGGAWTPEPPEEERPKPPLKPMKTGDRTVIIGQKPTDHSLRGTDHVQWIVDTRNQVPEADFRPHPLMVPQGTLEPLETLFDSYERFITFTSTVGGEALVNGCQVRADHRCSLAFGVEDRESWHHANSWRQATHGRIGDLVPHILNGYEEALARSERGDIEIPRERVDGQAICHRYYREVKHD